MSGIDESRRRKLRRVRRGGRPRVLDLFAGCGGISVGFDAAGYEVIAGVEIDPPAITTHARNFHSVEGDPIPEHSRAIDITDSDPDTIMKGFGIVDVAGSADVVVGGPPCQAFARVGRAKLREVAEHPEAFLEDPRSNLYLRYLEMVEATKPVAVLMENVPDVLNYGGHNIASEVAEVLSDLGYRSRYTMLNSVYYGVPQMRERMFLIGYAESVDPGDEWFPRPTHWIDLPQGYKGTRQVAIQGVKDHANADDALGYIDPPAADRDACEAAVTATDALADLPVLTAHLNGGSRKGPRRFDSAIPYPDGRPVHPYAQMMRTWPGFEAPTDGPRDHVIRHLPRDYAIFERMNPGDQYPEAHQHAKDLYEERLETSEGLSAAEAHRLFLATVPPYDPGKFPNKWRKMEPDAPARTLMAHLGKDGYSHIHYDSDQARTISVREAARLQSFPDGFVIEGPMNPAFRQIGNAVPPLMAKALAAHMLSTIRGSRS